VGEDRILAVEVEPDVAQGARGQIEAALSTESPRSECDQLR
jgi:hypothetical protein